MADEIKPIMRRFGLNFKYLCETKEGATMVKLTPDPEGAHSTCITCVNFDESRDKCTKYNAKPPSRVIAFGCKDYNDNLDIPF